MRKTCPDRYDLPWDPIRGDVVCELIPAWDGGPCSPIHGVRRYQWPQELWYSLAAELGWGDDGPASLNYALAILDHFLSPLADGPARHAGRWEACSQLAIDLTPAFCRGFVAPLGLWGGTIRGAEIRAWIGWQAEERSAEGAYLLGFPPLGTWVEGQS